MTLAEPPTVALVDPVNVRRGRLVVLAVSGRDRGVAARWVARWLEPEDRIHVVNIYEPIGLDGCHWEPVEQARSEQVAAAQRVVARNELPIRALGAAAEIGGSAIPGDPVDVLRRLSRVADVLVLGSDAVGADVCRKVLEGAQCTTIVLPAGYDWESGYGKPVTVVVTDADPARQAVRIALDEALRDKAPLRVLQLAGPVSRRRPVGDDKVALAEEVLWLRRLAPEAAIVADLDRSHPATAVAEAALHCRMLVIDPALLTILDESAGFDASPVMCVP
jgi:hypothetical protein